MDISNLLNLTLQHNDLQTMLSFAKIFPRTVISKQVFKDDFTKGFIYFLLNENNVVYIGSSVKMERLAQHPMKEYSQIAYIICDSYAYIEAALISHFKPKYNSCFLTKKKNINQKFTTALNPELIRLLKIAAIEKECSVSDILNETLFDYFSRLTQG